MISLALTSDCENCSAFCCVALAFDAGPKFAFDKAAAAACPHLDGMHLCSIHNELSEKGMSGCVRYECFGAGQRVHQEMFGGKSWRDRPELAQDMFDAFSILEKVHGILAMLDAAKSLPLPAPIEQRRQTYVDELTALPLEMDALRGFNVQGKKIEIDGFFAGLREEVSLAALRS